MAIDPQTAQSPIWTAVISASAGLIGVLIGGAIQLFSSHFVAERERKHRLEDEEAERSRAEEKREAERRYARALLARHLEAYAKECAQVMWDNANSDFEFEGERAAYTLPDFPEWPGIKWELLGASEMMNARDIALRVKIQRDGVEAGMEYVVSEPSQAAEYYRDAAAHLGLEAWKLAQQMRKEAGVKPLELRGGSNFAKALAEHVAELDKQQRELPEHTPFDED